MGDTLINQRYRLTRAIGEGGMGKVWAAEDTQTGRKVALKEIRPELVTGSPEFLKRFEREAELLHELNHPNIIDVLGFFQEGEHRYLVMPLMTGSLSDLLAREGRLAVRRVRQLGLDLCDALTRAHRLGVIHRDLKPDNILVDDDGNLVLTDFGVARLKAGTVLTQEGSMVGSVGYVSPEVCQGQDADERSDIWSLGVMFYEMLTGNTPFERDTVSATLTAILYEPPPPLEPLRPGVPIEMVNLLDAILTKDPSARIASVRQVAAMLEQVPDKATPKPAQPPTPTPPVQPATPTPRPHPATSTDQPGHTPVQHTPTPLPPQPPDQIRPDATLREVKTLYKGAFKTLMHADLWMLRRYGLAVLAGVILTAAVILLLHGRGENRDETAPTPTPAPAELLPHQRLLVVADFENVGTAGDQPIGRVMFDQLDPAYRILPKMQPVAVCHHAQTVTSEAGARDLGAALGADLVIWGTYRGDNVDVRLTPIDVPGGLALVDDVSLTHLPSMPIDASFNTVIFSSGVLMNQILLAKNEAGLAAMVFTLTQEWTRFEDVADSVPGETAALHMLRYYLLFPTDIDAALDEIDAALRQEALVPTLLWLRAIALSGSGRYDEALFELDTSLDLYPDFAAGHQIKCMLLMAQAEYDDALESCERFHELANSWYSGTLLSTNYLYLNRLDDAAQVSEAALADDPMIGFAHGLLSLAYMRQARFDESGELYRSWLLNYSDSTAGTRMMSDLIGPWDTGLVYDAQYPIVLGRYDEALEILEANQDVVDPSLSSYFTGQIYCILRDYEKSLEALNRAIEYNEAFELAYVMRGTVHRALNDQGAEQADFTKAAEYSSGEAFDEFLFLVRTGELDCTFTAITEHD